MNRARVDAAALRAAYGAHLGTHGGRVGYRCRTCYRYVRALVRAEATERESADAAP